ncbi:MAG: potassium channel family protein [Gaiellaceae bacterium]
MATRLNRRIERWYERLTLVRAVTTIIVIAVLLVLVAGLLVRVVEPETFHSIGLAYWWAVTTVTTVGYGDVVPESPGGRVVAAMLMLTGLALIPTLTSVIVSTLLYKSRRTEQDRIEHLEKEQATVLARIEERLERIERAQ